LSFTDPTADPVQPDPGQGEPGTSDAPYAEYLNRIPEDARGQVEPIFKEWDANTTRRFQEHSEYRKTWEPYEQAGVQQHNPESVQWALQFLQAAETNPQAIQQWFDAYAQERGLTPAQAAEQVAQDPGTFGDPYGDQSQQLSELLKQQLSPLQQQLEQMTQWREQQETAVREQEAQRFIHGQMDELRSKHPSEFTKEAEGYVEAFLSKYIESDPRNAVPRAWADYQTLVNEISKQVLQPKADAPAAPESGGAPDVTPKPIKTLKEAEAVALARLREANRA